MSTTVYPAYIIFVIRQIARMLEAGIIYKDPEFVNAVVLFGSVSTTFYMTVYMFSFYN